MWSHSTRQQRRALIDVAGKKEPHKTRRKGRKKIGAGKGKTRWNS